MGKVKKVLIYAAILFIGTTVAFTVTPYIRQFLFSTGIVPEKVLIAGTGSMYPTFPKGEGETDVVRASEIVAWPKMRRFPSGINVLGFSLFAYKLARGDIVDFENEKTKQISQEKYGQDAGFVKRIIAVAGDTINLRDGFVSLNGETLNEPYTAKPRSTFGGESLADCQNLTVPLGKIFVMGDNRKASLDSRFELGLVDISDIKYVLPFSDQGEYKKYFRDTSADLSFAHTTSLNPEEFVRILNEKRKEKNLKPLKYDKLLSLSAKRRGSIMISSDDFSTEATRSGVTMASALKEVGYRNIVTAEVFTRGYFEADELLENFAEFPQTQKILYSQEYQDIGLSAVLGDLYDCPMQVVVVHLGGYVPPNYKQADIDSWQKLLDNLIEVIPSWEALKDTNDIDKSKLEQLLSILGQRKNIASKVLIRMKANQWLTDEEENLVKLDQKLADDANSIVSQLNQR